MQEPEKPKGPDAPPEFHFSARMPTINALDLEVVKLTALFVAKRGKSFMTALSQRETRNWQFDFLRPQHSLYNFFTRLVDQYTELLQVNNADGIDAEKKRLVELEKNVKNKYHVLGRAKQRAEWLKFQEDQKQKKEEEKEKEKIEYAQIDWHDFVVVETVVFTETDDQAELPPPTSLNDLQTASLEQKAMISLQPQNRRIEEAMPTDDETSNYYNAYPPTQAPTLQLQYTPTAPTPTPIVPLPQQPIAVSTSSPQPPSFPSQPPTSVSTPTPISVAVAFQEEQAAQAGARAVPTPPTGQQPMRIRSDYVPRAQAKRFTSNVPTTICPNCRQAIPTSEIEHHMRIELLDPRWKEQRAKAEERYATTNLSTNEVFNNLKRLASQRTDVFDPVLDAAAGGQGSEALDPEEDARRKRLATGAGIGEPPALPTGIPGYDVPNGAPGMSNSGVLPQPPPAPPAVNIEEQIRRIHQKSKQ